MDLSEQGENDIIATLRKNHYAIYLAKMTKKIDELRQNPFLTASQKKFQLQAYNEILKDKLLLKVRRLEERILAAPANMAHPRFFLEGEKERLMEEVRQVMQMYRSVRAAFGFPD